MLLWVKPCQCMRHGCMNLCTCVCGCVPCLTMPAQTMFCCVCCVLCGVLLQTVWLLVLMSAKGTGSRRTTNASHQDQTGKTLVRTPCDTQQWLMR